MSAVLHGGDGDRAAPRGPVTPFRVDARKRWQALGLAAMLEGLVALGLLVLLGHAPAPAPPAVIALTIDAPPVPAEKQAEPPKPLPKVPPPLAVAKPQTVPVHPSPPPLAAQPLPAPALPPAAQAPPDAPDATVSRSAEAAPAAAPVAPSRVEAPPPPPPPPAENGDIARSYNAKLSAAVQAAFVVPSVARNMGFRGRARVEFGLRDGVVSALRVVQSSGLSAVDKAALAALQNAAFPAPPPSLQGKDGVYQIWVACY